MGNLFVTVQLYRADKEETFKTTKSPTNIVR